MSARAESEPPSVIVITGIMASGKSTVAQALAEKLPRAVHLRGDLFRRMIVSGREEMTPEMADEALAQLRMRYRAAAAAAREYIAAGFTVVHQDNIFGPLLSEVVAAYGDLDLHVVVLCPRPDVVEEREACRPKKGYVSFTVAELDRVLRAETPRIGLWLDSSDLSADETAEAILRSLPSARVAS